jgi:hypothetical protein
MGDQIISKWRMQYGVKNISLKVIMFRLKYCQSNLICRKYESTWDLNGIRNLTIFWTSIRNLKNFDHFDITPIANHILYYKE